MHRRHVGFLTCGALACSWVGIGVAPARADTASQLYVERAYHDLLGRVPTEAELVDSASALAHGTLTPPSFADALTSGGEFHGDEARQQYQALLRRASGPIELTLWVAALNGGQTVEAMQSDIAGSTEYFAGHGGTNAGFLTAVYPDLLGRAISPIEGNQAAAALASGETRPAFASAILSSLEYDQRLVQGYYPRFLHRPADPGFALFVNELQEGVRDEQVIAQFVGSAEYQALKLTPGDANFDQRVDFSDLLALAQYYGRRNAHWFNGDFNNDGSVGFDDLLMLAQHYGKSTAGVGISSATAVPEPTEAFALFTSLIALRRRRKG